MDCCSSNYMDYRHSINNNFCYPFSPGMMRGASPYPLPPGSGGRYGPDYRTGYYDGSSSFDKFYSSYHPASGSGPAYGGNYYGNSYSSYREFAYNDYYHPSSPSSHPFPGPPPPGSFHGPHMFNRHQSLPHPFQRESYYHQREHHQYAAGNFSSFSGNPFKRADSNQGSSATNSSTATNATSNGSCSSPGSSTGAGESPLFGYTHSPDYSAQSYNSGSSPSHPHHHRYHPLPPHSPGGEGGGNGYPPSAMPNATGYPLSMKDARMRKLKERKLAKSASSYGNGSPNRGQSTNSTSSSPNPGSCGSNGSSTDARLKSLDAPPLACDNYDRDGTTNSPASRHASPGRSAGPLRASNSPAGGAAGTGASPPKRSKKQSAKHRTAAEHDKQQSTTTPAKSGDPGNNSSSSTPAAGADRNVTPLPGFQQAFGSTEIGRFSEVFFNSTSPGPNELHPDGQLPPPSHHHHPHPHPHHQLPHPSSMMMMDSPDVDSTLSPQPWEPTGPGDPYETTSAATTTTAFNLQIGTSFHPSYYESPSYASSSDHAVDSPLGNYFSEMTCGEYVN
nr:trithorax group protein osa-like [Aedes albopictus]